MKAPMGVDMRGHLAERARNWAILLIGAILIAGGLALASFHGPLATKPSSTDVADGTAKPASAAPTKLAANVPEPQPRSAPSASVSNQPQATPTTAQPPAGPPQQAAASGERGHAMPPAASPNQT